MSYASAGLMLIISLFLLLIALVFAAIGIVATWKIFTKAGREGWKCLIPVYNSYLFFKICGMSGLWVIYTFIAAIVINIAIYTQSTGLMIAALILWIGDVVLMVVQGYKLGRVFGKGTAYCIFSALFTYISTLILGFGKSQWHDPEDIF